MSACLNFSFGSTNFQTVDHPYFLGFQAHPEFCTRPLNPSPPFLGFVAAAAGYEVLEEQIQKQRNFKPPHPAGVMISEAELKELGSRGAGTQTQETEGLVNGTSH